MQNSRHIGDAPLTHGCILRWIFMPRPAGVARRVGPAFTRGMAWKKNHLLEVRTGPWVDGSHLGTTHLCKYAKYPYVCLRHPFYASMHQALLVWTARYPMMHFTSVVPIHQELLGTLAHSPVCPYLHTRCSGAAAGFLTLPSVCESRGPLPDRLTQTRAPRRPHSWVEWEPSHHRPFGHLTYGHSSHSRKRTKSALQPPSSPRPPPTGFPDGPRSQTGNLAVTPSAPPQPPNRPPGHSCPPCPSVIPSLGKLGVPYQN